MKTKDEIKASRNIWGMEVMADGYRGVIHVGNWEGTYIATYGGGWDHVSVAPRALRITPSWDDMCKIKDIFFNDDEAEKGAENDT